MVIDGIRSGTAEENIGTRAFAPGRFLSRQPILDGRRDVAGYEILFSAGWEDCLGSQDAAAGLQALTGNRLAFIHCTHEDLVSHRVVCLPPKSTVLQVPRLTEPDTELLKACTSLHALGYALALEDLSPRPEMQPFLNLANYVKVDFVRSDSDTVVQIRKALRGRRAKLVGDKVEDQMTFTIARSGGIDLFQGHFFCRPSLMANRKIPPSRMAYIRLLMELARNPLNTGEIMRIVMSEPSLCYRLLLLANSPLWGMRNDITSPRHAFMLLGENRFRSLVAVATACVLGQEQPSALITLSLQRARFCETLAPHVDENPSEQFMLGLLSLLDATLETPMDSIVKSLPLRSAAKDVLLGSTTPVAVPLALIRAFEEGDWATCASAAAPFRLSEELLTGLYVDSVTWATDSLATSN